MTPDEFREGRLRLKLTRSRMARLLRVESGSTICKWESGRRKIPGPVEILMKWIVDGEEPVWPRDLRQGNAMKKRIKRKRQERDEFRKYLRAFEKTREGKADP